MSPESSSSQGAKDAPEAATTLPVRERTKEDFEKIQLAGILDKDLIHSAAIQENQKRIQAYFATIRNATEDYKKIKQEYRQSFPPNKIYGQGYNGYGNGFTDLPATRLVYPYQKPKLGNKKAIKKAPRLIIKRKDVEKQAQTVEQLVPIRIEVDWDKIKLQDTFTWNLSDRTVSTGLFAQQMVEDFGLTLPAANPVVEQVQRQLEEQLNDFYCHLTTYEDALDPELPYSAYKNDEMRILIKLNITIGLVTLEDRFEWEINNPINSAEEFARVMAMENGLSGEFTTAIAHCIREQSQLFTRSLYVTGHQFDGRPVEDAEVVAAFLPTPIPSVFRPYQQAKDYMPYMYEQTEADMEKNEVIYSREQRRQKRSVTRRGGPPLPDLKDRQRTVRTRIVSSVIPNCVEKVERPTDNPIYKRISVAKKKGLRDGDLSESSESEDSSPDSPAMVAVAQGTARTRGMRGAATAAQIRMANLGRSETPESLVVHHHETRTSARRTGRDAREESLEPTSLIVKLKVGKERLRKWARDRLKATRPNPQTGTPQPRPSFPPTTTGGSMGPPSTPGSQNSKLPTATSTTPAQIGRVEAPPMPPPGMPQPPPPECPAWLEQGLQNLRDQYPRDRFEGVMRHTAVDAATDLPVPAPPAGQPTPANIKFMYLPRIRCLDCPGKSYTPGPEMTVVNFEVHLKNRQHRERVELHSTQAAASN